MLLYLKINLTHQTSNECSSKVNKLKPLWTNNIWKNTKYDTKTTDLGVASHPSFQVHWEPVWHIDHFKPLLNFFFKIYFPKVFNFTWLYIRRNVQVPNHINTSSLLIDFHVHLEWLWLTISPWALQSKIIQVKG